MSHRVAAQWHNRLKKEEKKETSVVRCMYNNFVRVCFEESFEKQKASKVNIIFN